MYWHTCTCVCVCVCVCVCDVCDFIFNAQSGLSRCKNCIWFNFSAHRINGEERCSKHARRVLYAVCVWKRGGGDKLQTFYHIQYVLTVAVMILTTQVPLTTLWVETSLPPASHTRRHQPTLLPPLEDCISLLPLSPASPLLGRMKWQTHIKLLKVCVCV